MFTYRFVSIDYVSIKFMCPELASGWAVIHRRHSVVVNDPMGKVAAFDRPYDCCLEGIGARVLRFDRISLI